MGIFKRPRLYWNTIQGLHDIPLSELEIRLSITLLLSEIVSLLLESGVDINLRNYRGQTSLMQACQYGHWEVVQTLILFGANIHRADYLNGGTALHLAALNGHSRFIRLLLADYIPSISDCWKILLNKSENKESTSDFNESALHEVINKPADGGVTPLHMAALNGQVESVQLLLNLGASVTEVSVEDGKTIDLIGPGSTALHYAACGGNAQCCEVCLCFVQHHNHPNAQGEKGLMYGASDFDSQGCQYNCHKCEREILSNQPEGQSQALLPSPFLSLPLMSIVKIAREFGWRTGDSLFSCQDLCAVCLNRQCTVAAEGCDHEFCIQCALYLCSTNTTTNVARRLTGSIACPLCRHRIVSFVKLPGTKPTVNAVARTSFSLSFCACSSEMPEPTSMATPFCKPAVHCTQISHPGSLFCSISRQGFPSMKIHSNLCIGAPNTSPLVPFPAGQNLHGLRRSASEGRRSWFSTFNQSVTTGNAC
ncbi:E3 ubiquitin-protein ligase XBAT32 [Hibiscus syriacus]|uniref:RING-type E3 ubiquitin transferase n=1 Tax=Hibiscus syriacus TaxID=106335 RepID=A0A6A3CI86_HIBSY|nr:E3 ubiquitin-protein ligase XBAT32 [Hibiscus syriacus]